MTTRTTKLFTGMAAGSLLLTTTALTAQTGRDEAPGPYYEKDAWYDITEWLDGNDYNPTDEAWWRWDDEKYDFHEDTGTDWDSDVYGFDDTDASDDWYYDYYDDDYVSYYDYDLNDSYEFTSHYIDTNNDGYIDAYYSFHDSDGDNTFDEVSFVAFNEYGESARSRTQSGLSRSNEWKQSTSPKTISGQVTKTKTATVRDQKRQLVEVRSQRGETVIIDLGSQRDLSQFDFNEGDQISASGFISRVGDKPIFLAKSISINGKTHQVDRGGKQLSGNVKEVKTFTLRGQEHTLAIIDTKDRKQAMVDLGPSDKLPMRVSQGQKITVEGVPVKVQDRFMVLATRMEANGQMHSINRSTGKSASDMKDRRPDTNERDAGNRGTNPERNPGR